MQRTCNWAPCGNSMSGKRVDALYCSPSCKTMADRYRHEQRPALPNFTRTERWPRVWKYPRHHEGGH